MDKEYLYVSGDSCIHIKSIEETGSIIIGEIISVYSDDSGFYTYIMRTNAPTLFLKEKCVEIKNTNGRLSDETKLNICKAFAKEYFE